MATHGLHQVQGVSAARPDVARYFQAPENLQNLTPPFLNFRLLTASPVAMQVGALIDYRISLHGVPLGWRSRIEEFVPGQRFVDLQLRGPYRLWRHLHTFEDLPSGGTKIADWVEFELPFGPLGEVAYRLFVRENLRRIFAYRAQQIVTLFGAVPGQNSPEPQFV